jgi:hypothetical protein
MYTKVVAVDSTAFENWYKNVSVKQSKGYEPMLVAASGPTETTRP